MFGAPKFKVKVSDNNITGIHTVRGAPCGATWEAAKNIVGLSAKEAVTRIGLETQFFCSADPANWDPIYGKSPVHFAGNAHSAALKKALKS
jgi:thymidylate synthase